MHAHVHAILLARNRRSTCRTVTRYREIWRGISGNKKKQKKKKFRKVAELVRGEGHLWDAYIKYHALSVPDSPDCWHFTVDDLSNWLFYLSSVCIDEWMNDSEWLLRISIDISSTPFHANNTVSKSQSDTERNNTRYHVLFIYNWEKNRDTWKSACR